MGTYTGDEERSEQAAHFPLCPSIEFDTWYMNLSYPLGLKSDYPAEYKQRVVSAAVSYEAGLKSVDYTIKRYGSLFPGKEETRLDIEVAEFLENSQQYLHELNHSLTRHGDENLGRALFELVLHRQLFSFQQALTLANRGAKFECLCIVRMQVEQLAWASSIDFVDDSEKIRSTRAQSSISSLKRHYPEAGRLYGYLSKFAHWDYEAQIESLTSDGGKLGVLLASVESKIELYKMLISLTSILATMIVTHRSEYFSELGIDAQATENCDQIKQTAQEYTCAIDQLSQDIDGK